MKRMNYNGTQEVETATFKIYNAANLSESIISEEKKLDSVHLNLFLW